MAKSVYDYNGTTATQIKKIYDYNGSTATQIKKAYDYNGSTATQVYAAEVTLTNLVGSAAKSHSAAVDIGYSDYNHDLQTFTLTSGHRYYVRADASTWGSFTAGGASIVNFVDNETTQVCSKNTGQIIRAAGQASCKVQHHWTGSCASGVSAGCSSNLYMVVDITNLEAMTGTLTAAQVWSYFGSAVWYNNKTISV